MFDLPILDIFLTLSFTYFLLSLIVSSINEIITSLRKVRSRMLKEAMQEWIEDDQWKDLWDKKISQSPFITSLMRPDSKNSFPSYIPSSNFAQAVLSRFRDGNNEITADSIRRALSLNAEERKKLDQLVQETAGNAQALNDKLSSVFGGQVPQKVQDFLGNDLSEDGIRKALARVEHIGDATRDWLLAMLDQAGKDMKALEKVISQSFDHSMDRVSGWFKRHVKYVLFCIGFGLAALMNIDTVEIATVLWKNPQEARTIADRAAAALQKISQDSSGNFTVNFADDSSVTRYVVKTRKFIHPGKDSTKKDTITSVDTLFNVVEKEAVRIGQAGSALKSLQIPMGWKKGNYPSCNEIMLKFKDDCCLGVLYIILAWLIKFVGIALTAGAITLGAPFWFEMAGKLVNLRGTGSRPSSKTAPHPKTKK